MDSGVASARGSACSMKWTAAELLDTTRGRTGGGERSTTSPGEGSGEAASRCVARAAVAVGHLPACLAGKQLAGAVLGWAGRWAGSRRQVSFFHFFLFSVFLILLQLC